MPDLDATVEELEAGEAWLETDQVVDVEIKQPLDKVVPVRLAADRWEQLRCEARDRGIGPSTLVRMWVLEKLREVTRNRQIAQR